MTEYTEDWRAAGACVSADPDLFFPVSAAGPGVAQAERACQVCSSCTVRQSCLEFAMQHAEVDGIWGGTTADERVRARRVHPVPRQASRPARSRSRSSSRAA